MHLIPHVHVPIFVIDFIAQRSEQERMKHTTTGKFRAQDAPESTAIQTGKGNSNLVAPPGHS